MFSLLKKSGTYEYIVVFLGNPGPKYEWTRHNAGFLTCDAAEHEEGISVKKLRFKAYTGEAYIGNHRVLLMKPQTFMNLSGQAVKEAVKFYKIAPEKVIVVSDDITLPLGKLRIRKKGSSGGHNGLKSIAAELGSEEYPRVKIGVGIPPHKDYDVIDWVMSTFKNQDAIDIKLASEKAWKAVKCIITDGAEKAMNSYNG